MTDLTADHNAFAELEDRQAPRANRAATGPDRLPPMLFLAALIHGILIVGVTFNPLAHDDRGAISLEVTIIAEPERSLSRNDDAAYLAQATQEGAGNTTLDVRPGALPDTDAPFENPGEEAGNALATTREAEAAADTLITTRAPGEEAAADLPREDPAVRSETALALEKGVDLTLPLPEDELARFELRSDDPRELVTTVDTREAVIAGYLHRWKRKIEAIGLEHFPEQALIEGVTGSPTLEVTIEASGALHEVVLRRSSGSRLLDQAALDILRRAAPFDAFPEAVRADYDRLRFAYKWQFSRIEVPSAAQRTDSP
ncbi:MAG TPA: energy transducer TonB [Woeseiaceae bacterium]|nr:energy transducer TonB [Woeseiaceae bacterium]